MSRRKSGYKPDSARVCAHCGRSIAALDAVWLLQTGAGKIIGPYHARCAAILEVAAYRHAEDQEPNGVQMGQVVAEGREETLPW